MVGSAADGGVALPITALAWLKPLYQAVMLTVLSTSDSKRCWKAAGLIVEEVSSRRFLLMLASLPTDLVGFILLCEPCAV